MTTTAIKTADEFRVDAAQILSEGVLVAEVLGRFMKQVSRFSTEMNATYETLVGDIRDRFGVDFARSDGGYDTWMSSTGDDAVFDILHTFSTWCENPPSPEDIDSQVDGLRQLADGFTVPGGMS